MSWNTIRWTVLAVAGLAATRPAARAPAVAPKPGSEEADSGAAAPVDAGRPRGLALPSGLERAQGPQLSVGRGAVWIHRNAVPEVPVCA